MCRSERSSDSRSAPNRGRHTFDPTRERRLLGACAEDPLKFRRVFTEGARPKHWAILQMQHLFRLMIRLDHEGKLNETEVLTAIMRCPDKQKYPPVEELTLWMNDKELQVEASATALIEDWHRREELKECERYMGQLSQGYCNVDAARDEHIARILALAEGVEL